MVQHQTGRKAKMGFLVATGLKVCSDPTAPLQRKILAGTKLVYCGGYAGAHIITNIAVVAPQAKILASACCTVSWGFLTALEYIESKGHM